jgi:nucleoside-diphosphate-sugar epimerase
LQILISGSSGFLGSNFRSYLMPFAKYKFITLSRSQSIDNTEDISWKLDQLLPNEINTVLHFAGKAHDFKKSDSKEYFEVNTKLSLRLFNAFLASNAVKFIFMSTVKASADSITGTLTEDTICQPLTAYGQSKYQAECEIQKLLVQYNILNPNKKKTLYILRPCIIHGPGNKGNLNLLFNLVSKGLPWPLGAFKNNRSFCSIENLMFILKELIDRDDIPSGIYNVADDEPLSTNELINLIATSQNRKPNIWILSKGIIEKIAKLGDKLHLPLNSERLHKLTSSYVVSNSKIKNALGKPLPVSSTAGLLKTFKYFNSI